MAKTGSVNVNMEIFLLMSPLDMSQEGKLEAVLLVMGCLKKYNSGLAYNPTHVDIDYSSFKESAWTDIS